MCDEDAETILQRCDWMPKYNPANAEGNIHLSTQLRFQESPERCSVHVEVVSDFLQTLSVGSGTKILDPAT